MPGCGAPSPSEGSSLIDLRDDITALDFDRDGRRLAVGVVGHVLIVDVGSGRTLRRFRLDAPHWFDLEPWQVTMSAAGDRVVVQTIGLGLTNADDCASELFVADLSTRGRAARLVVLDEHDLATRAVRGDGAAVACGSQDGSVELFDLATEQRLARAPIFAAPVSVLGFSASGRRLGAASWGGDLAVLDATHLSIVARWTGTPRQGYGAIAFADDDATVIRTVEPYGGTAGNSVVVATLGRRSVQTFPMTRVDASAIAHAPAKARLAAISGDGRVFAFAAGSKLWLRPAPPTPPAAGSERSVASARGRARRGR